MYIECHVEYMWIDRKNPTYLISLDKLTTS